MKVSTSVAIQWDQCEKEEGRRERERREMGGRRARAMQWQSQVELTPETNEWALLNPLAAQPPVKREPVIAPAVLPSDRLSPVDVAPICLRRLRSIDRRDDEPSKSEVVPGRGRGHNRMNPRPGKLGKPVVGSIWSKASKSLRSPGTGWVVWLSGLASFGRRAAAPPPRPQPPPRRYRDSHRRRGRPPSRRRRRRLEL